MKESSKLIRKYAEIDEPKDTTVITKGIVSIYENGKLSSIGKEIKSEKRGRWCFFDSSRMLILIIDYKNGIKNKSDTLKEPLARINKRW